MYILSQYLLIGADILYVLAMLNKNKRGLVFYLMIYDMLFAFHYLCLGEYTGVAMISVDVLYLLALYLLDHFEKTKYNLYLSLGAMIITLVIFVFTWRSALSLLPMFAMLIYLPSMIFDNIVIVKIGGLIRNILNAVYLFIIMSHLAVFFETGLVVSAIVGIIISLKERKQLKSLNFQMNTK